MVSHLKLWQKDAEVICGDGGVGNPFWTWGEEIWVGVGRGLES